MKIEIVDVIAEVGDFDLGVGQVYEVVKEYDDGDVEVILPNGQEVTVFSGEYKVIEE